MITQKTHVSIRSVVFLLLVILSGCRDIRERFSPTEPGDLAPYANFYAGETSNQGFGVYKGHEYFFIQVPAGEYLLRYVTQTGQYYMVFRADKNAQLRIGLASGGDVSTATLYPGRITNTSNPLYFGVVTVFSELGASGTGDQLFSKSDNNGVQLIGGVGIEYTAGNAFFRLHIPSGGVYHLTYITQNGHFEIEFTVEDNAIKDIGLSNGDIVQEAYILKK